MKVTFEILDDKITISKSFSGYYITVNTPDYFMYLHRNGDIAPHCGKENFFNTFEDATKFITTLKKNLQPKYIEIQLNELYTAKVYKDKIEVGCETFPVSIIDELYKAHSDIC